LTTEPHVLTEFGFCIHENIYFLPCSDLPNEIAPNHYFSIEDQFVYCPFARDFGPFNLGVMLRFCELMDEKTSEFSNCKIILHCPKEPEKCTNVAFLLGAFLVHYANINSFSCKRTPKIYPTSLYRSSRWTRRMKRHGRHLPLLEGTTPTCSGRIAMQPAARSVAAAAQFPAPRVVECPAASSRDSKADRRASTTPMAAV
jgi:hypothetical protein